jgi:hypothetical protein
VRTWALGWAILGFLVGCMGTSGDPLGPEGPDTGSRPSRNVMPPGERASLPENPAPTRMELEIVHSSSEFVVLTMDSIGSVFGLRKDSGSTLWESIDGARTWRMRGASPDRTDFRRMAALEDGTLLATVSDAGQHFVARSTDRGASWTKVLTLDKTRILYTRAIAELDGTVYLGEYQTKASPPTPIRIWASDTQGASWSVRHTFYGYRHLHALIPDPKTHSLWGLTGDSTGDLLRSRDGGRTWMKIVPGTMGVAVDAVVTDKGLLYGTDAVNKPARTAIVLVKPDDTWEVVRDLPGPSYGVLHHSSGGYLMGSSRAPAGTVHAPGDESSRLFGSVDGVTWNELLNYKRLTVDSTAHSHAHWELPSGEVLIQLVNLQGFGADGDGYLVARPKLLP